MKGDQLEPLRKFGKKRIIENPMWKGHAIIWWWWLIFYVVWYGF